jgi:hypothetical protein
MNVPHHVVFKGPRTTRILLAVLGTLLCFLAVVFQCLPYEDWTSQIAAFLFLTLPPGLCGLYFLHAAWLLRQARVVVDDEGVELNVPNLKAGWLFRSEPVCLRWDEICCVQHEQELVIAGGKRLDQYWIHSARGTFLLTEALCREAATAAQLIAMRKTIIEVAPPPPAAPPVTLAQEEADLKRKAVTVVVILFALMGGIILACTSETAGGQIVQKGLWLINQLSILLFLVTTVISLFGFWRSARRERLRLQQTGRAEKIEWRRSAHATHRAQLFL